MRIAILNQFYHPDIAPTASLASALADHLAQKGHEVTVVASQGGYTTVNSASASEQSANPIIHRLWTPRFGKSKLIGRLMDYLSYYVLALWTLLTLPGQDVVVALTTPPLIAYAGWVHRLLHPRCRLVLWNMDCYPEAPEMAGMIRSGGLASRVLRGLNRFLFRRLDQIICLDSAMQELLQANYAGAIRLPTEIVPNFEASRLFPKSTRTRTWSFNSERPLVILYQGNAGVGHEFETVVECARLLRDEPVVFRFVGGGKWWNWLSEQAHRTDLPAWEVFGYIPKEQTPQLLAEADVSLITLRAESRGVMSPSKLHSNLAAGLPVLGIGPVGSNVDEAISRFGCGVSIRNGEAKAAADFVVRILRDATFGDELSRRARHAFDSAYCDTVTLPQLQRLVIGQSDSLAIYRPTADDPADASCEKHRAAA